MMRQATGAEPCWARAFRLKVSEVGSAQTESESLGWNNDKKTEGSIYGIPTSQATINLRRLWEGAREAILQKRD